MSRAINVKGTPEAVTALCASHALRISVIEPLQSGGVRVVMLEPRKADTLRGLMKGKLIQGEVVRSASHVARQLPAATSRR